MFRIWVPSVDSLRFSCSARTIREIISAKPTLGRSRGETGAQTFSVRAVHPKPANQDSNSATRLVPAKALADRPKRESSQISRDLAGACGQSLACHISRDSSRGGGSHEHQFGA